MCGQIREDERQAEEDRFMEDVGQSLWNIGQSLEEFWANQKKPVLFEVNVSDQSEAIENFGYDPFTQEFMIQWQTSDQRYIYPQVSPDEAADFLRNAWEKEPVASYGKAANDFKKLHESTRVMELRKDEAVRKLGTMTPSEISSMVAAMRELAII